MEKEIRNMAVPSGETVIHLIILVCGHFAVEILRL